MPRKKGGSAKTKGRPVEARSVETILIFNPETVKKHVFDIFSERPCETLSLLIEGNDLDLIKKFAEIIKSNEPLIYETYSIESYESLIQNLNSDEDKQKELLKTLYQFVINDKYNESIKAFLNNLDIKIANFTNCDEKAKLLYGAAAFGALENIKLLLKLGFDPNVKFQDKWSTLYFSLLYQYLYSDVYNTSKDLPEQNKKLINLIEGNKASKKNEQLEIITTLLENNALLDTDFSEALFIINKSDGFFQKKLSKETKHKPDKPALRLLNKCKILYPSPLGNTINYHKDTVSKLAKNCILTIHNVFHLTEDFQIIKVLLQNSISLLTSLPIETYGKLLDTKKLFINTDEINETLIKEVNKTKRDDFLAKLYCYQAKEAFDSGDYKIAVAKIEKAHELYKESAHKFNDNLELVCDILFYSMKFNLAINPDKSLEHINELRKIPEEERCLKGDFTDENLTKEEILILTDIDKSKAFSLLQSLPKHSENQIFKLEVMLRLKQSIDEEINKLFEEVKNLHPIEQLNSITNIKLLQIYILYYDLKEEYEHALKIIEYIIFNQKLITKENLQEFAVNYLIILHKTPKWQEGNEFLDKLYKTYQYAAELKLPEFLYYQYVFRECVGKYELATKLLKELEEYNIFPYYKKFIDNAIAIRKFTDIENAQKAKLELLETEEAFSETPPSIDEQISYAEYLNSITQENSTVISLDKWAQSNLESEASNFDPTKFHQFIKGIKQGLYKKTVDEIIQGNNQTHYWKIEDKLYSTNDTNIIKISSHLPFYVWIDKNAIIDPQQLEKIKNAAQHGLIRANSKGQNGIKCNDGIYKIKWSGNDRAWGSEVLKNPEDSLLVLINKFGSHGDFDRFCKNFKKQGITCTELYIHSIELPKTSEEWEREFQNQGSENIPFLAKMQKPIEGCSMLGETPTPQD